MLEKELKENQVEHMKYVSNKYTEWSDQSLQWDAPSPFDA